MTRLRSREYPAHLATRPAHVPESSVVTVLRVPPESAGMRLDRFVQTQLKRTSRTRTQTIIENSAFGPDGARLRAGHRVAAEQHILLWRAPWDETPVPTDLPVLFEDEHYFAVAKPAGLPVHPTARYYHNTVVKLLEVARPAQTFTLAHRLDRETSGVLLLAKSREADRRIKKALQERTGIEKRYLAMTWGAPADDRFRIDLPVELDPTSRLRVRMRVAAQGEGLWASTSFDVLRRATSGARTYAFIACRLETGRQHQIRVHLAAHGVPVVGDKLYGPDPELFARGADGELSDADRAVLEIDRHALHAAELGFAHPFSSERILVRAPLPDDMIAFWRGESGEAPPLSGNS